MTVATDSEKVLRATSKYDAPPGRTFTRTSFSYEPVASDERETKAVRSSRPYHRQRRVAPDTSPASHQHRRMAPSSSRNKDDVRHNTNGATPKTRRRSSKSKRQQLKVDTEHSQDYSGKIPETPQTVASSIPSPVSSDLRTSDDLRSPGQRKSPVAAKVEPASDNSPIPDFITQTDRFGNATTPRSEASVEKARVAQNGAKPRPQDPANDTSEEEVNVCAETFFDSLRLVCCCLMPDVSGGQTTGQKSLMLQDGELHVDEVPRLLPKLHPDDFGKKCLVLDLDETLVHSSFRAVTGADFVIPVQIEDVVHFVYVSKRPGVDEFLTEMAKYYEIVIYTASLNKYADPLLDLLDPNRVIRTRLFRESCVYFEGNYVKDLSLLDRDLKDSIIVDNSPNSYIFHPENAIDCSSYIDDPNDRELDQIGAFLKGIKDIKDVRGNCSQWRKYPNINIPENQ